MFKKAAKALIALVIACMVMAFCSVMAEEADIIASGTCGNNITWQLDSSRILHISGQGSMKSFTSEKSAPWYKFFKQIRGVDIENGITSIGKKAFCRYTGLVSITIPESLVSIDADAFMGSRIRTVIASDLNSWIGISFQNKNSNPLVSGGALYFGDELVTDVVIPEGTTSIGNYAFLGCGSLANITIPESVDSIGSNAFALCSSLENVYAANLESWLRMSLSSSSSNPMFYADQLYFGGEPVESELILPDGLENIGNYIFSGCKGFTSIVLPESITDIGNGAFYNCSGLADIIIPENVTSIGGSAFYGCNGLTSIVVPENVTAIGDSAFYNCSNLAAVLLPESVILAEDAELFTNDPTIHCFRGSSVDVWAQAHSYTVRYLNEAEGKPAINLPEKRMLNVGESFLLWSDIPESTESLTIDWESSDPETVSVDETGKITALKRGDVTITVTVNGISDSMVINVRIYPESFIPWANGAEILQGLVRDVHVDKEIQIELKNLQPENADLLLEWESLDPSLATISDTGLIKTIACGDVSFTIRSITGFEYTFDLSIYPPIESVKFETDEGAGDEFQYAVAFGAESVTLPLTAIAGDYTIYGGELLKYSSSNPEIATIDIFGNITPLKAGTTVITAQAESGASDTCFLTLTCQEGTHDPQEVPAREPDCVNDGYSAYEVCSFCGEIITPPEIIPAFGHDEVGHDAKDATCTEAGWEEYITCLLCDYTTYVEIPALGHVEVIDAGIAPTCTETGLTEGKHCALCEEVILAQEVIDVLDHTPMESGGFEPTDFTDGKTSEIYCSACGEFLSEGEIIPAYCVVQEGKLIEYNGTTANLVIPAELGITSIGDCAFWYNTALTSIILPDGVASIGDSAFSECDNLTTVDIPDGVTGIGDSAFSGCDSLTNIDIPDGVTSIGNGAFSECDSLTNVDIPDGVTSIGNSAFRGCDSLTNIDIPDGVTSIGKSAFGDCSSLNSIVIPDSLVEIGEHAFVNCNNLLIYCKAGTAGAALGRIGLNFIDLDYPDYLLCQIDDENRAGIIIKQYTGTDAEVDIPSAIGTVPVIEIGLVSFENCADITNVVIPEGVERIASSAFSNCTNLINVDIPDSVVDIGDYAFYNCCNLTDIVIPEGVLAIGEYTFYNCANLISVVISEGLESIGDSAFHDCSNLAGIDLPAGLISIGENAFCNADSLSSIVIPNSVTAIGNNAFGGCYNLMIYCKVGTIGAAISASGLDFIDPDYPSYRIRQINDAEDASGIVITDYIGSDDKVVLPSAIGSVPVRKIGDNAFKNHYGLMSVIIPDGVTDIGAYAFNACSSLVRLDLPESVTSIGDYAFDNCINLTDVSIPEGITGIGVGTFSGCSSLTSVIIPEGVTHIKAFAFRQCSSLRSISIPESVTEVENWAFANCTGLKNIVMQGWEKPSFVLDIPTRFTIYCHRYSGVDYWAEDNQYTVSYIENAWPVDFSLIAETDKIMPGESVTIIPCAFPSLDDLTIQWESSDPAVASVENGVVTAYSVGKTLISAVCGSKTASMYITVYDAVESFDLSADEVWMVTRTNRRIDVQNILPENALASFSLISSDPDVVTAEMATLGETSYIKIAGRMPGDAVITIMEDNTGILRECLVHVFYPVTEVAFGEASVTVPVKTVHQLVASVTSVMASTTQSCVNKLVAFESADPGIASVDDNGIVTGHAWGKTMITATAESGVSASCEVIVTHDDHEPVVDKAIDPTCAATGLTEGSSCAICKKVLVPQEIIPALPHTEVIDAAVASTCISTGLSEGKHCSVCNKVLVEQETVPMGGHETEFSKNVYEMNRGESLRISWSPRCIYCRRNISVQIQVPQWLRAVDYKNNSCAVLGYKVGVSEILARVVDDYGRTTSCNVVGHAVEQMVLPEALTIIADEAFAGLTADEVILSKKVVRIGTKAFANSKNLALINLPDDVQIGVDAFVGCNKLTIICSEGSTGHHYAEANGIPYVTY